MPSCRRDTPKASRDLGESLNSAAPQSTRSGHVAGSGWSLEPMNQDLPFDFV